ncbi:MAG TPA: hypothetical protein VFJ57_02905 [Solirubrobacterales bacterium]|nr:hypothetical protein [Solirubrobacterales bacterium]
MQSMRESWTDERLDDLRADVVALRVETKAGFDRVDDQFKRMYRLLLVLGGTLVAALISAMGAIAAVAISQLG